MRIESGFLSLNQASKEEKLALTFSRCVRILGLSQITRVKAVFSYVCRAL